MHLSTSAVYVTGGDGRWGGGGGGGKGQCTWLHSHCVTDIMCESWGSGKRRCDIGKGVDNGRCSSPRTCCVPGVRCV